MILFSLERIRRRRRGIVASRERLARIRNIASLECHGRIILLSAKYSNLKIQVLYLIVKLLECVLERVHISFKRAIRVFISTK